MDGFFYLITADDEGRLIEFVCRRYADVEYILNLDLLEFKEFYDAARQAEAEEKLWERWLSVYPYMALGYLKTLTFREYREKMMRGSGGRPIDRRSEEKIIAELEKLHGRKLV